MVSAVAANTRRGAGKLIYLHNQATTTPKARAAIEASTEPASALAERLDTTEQTVCKWKHRDMVHDRSHTPHRLQTTLTPPQHPQTNAIPLGDSLQSPAWQRVERFNGRMGEVL